MATNVRRNRGSRHVVSGDELMSHERKRMANNVQLVQSRSGARFCTRGGMWYFSFRYKVFGIGKNRDTKAGEPVSAGQPVTPLQICRFTAKFSRHRSQLHIPPCYGLVLVENFINSSNCHCLSSVIFSNWLGYINWTVFIT